MPAVSEPAREPESPRRSSERAHRGKRFVVGLGFLSLAMISAWLYWRQLESRSAGEEFVRNFTLDIRRPTEVQALRLEPAADLQIAIAVDLALQDVPERAPGGNLPAGVRRSWAQVPLRRAAQLRTAHGLLLQAIANRPGWAYHFYLLGRTTYLLLPEEDSSPREATKRWAGPLRVASEAAPGLDPIWNFMAEATLERWSDLTGSDRSAAGAVLRRAFLDPKAVSRHYATASQRIGSSQAVQLLPEASGPISAALLAVAESGQIREAAALLPRLERATRKERAASLLQLEKRFRLGDLEGLRNGCIRWCFEHPVGEFDDPLGRAQTARVLELWPSEPTGPWNGDFRGELVRFFLAGRETNCKGEVLRAAVESLTGVPDAVWAQVKLHAGDREGAEELTGTDSAGPEWSSYFVKVAMLELKAGRAATARSALERIPTSSRDGCDVLLARRSVARELGDAAELALVAQRLQWLDSASAREAAGDSGLSLCLDPEGSRREAIRTGIESAAPAIVDYGWDGGRSGTLAMLDRRTVWKVSARGLSGLKTLSVRTVAGGPVERLRLLEVPAESAPR